MGLIGGSLGMAFKKKCPDLKITGVARTSTACKNILSLKAADTATTDLIEAVKSNDWIILATPPSSFENILKLITPILTSSHIVTDVGSIKAPVMKIYKKFLQKKGISYIGSHPIAGSEKKGIEAARSNLFENATCVITPDKNTSPKTLKQTQELWKKIGMKPVFKKPEEHDAIFACISHLPHLISWGLAGTLPKNQFWDGLAGEAWRDMTRVAHSSPDLWSEIFLCNQKNLLKFLQKFSRILEKLKTSIKQKKLASLTRNLRLIQEELKR